MKMPGFLVALGALALAVACCCCTWLPSLDWDQLVAPLVTLEPILTEDATPEPSPVVTREPLPAEAQETVALLETTDIPLADLHELTVRLRGLSPDTPRTINPQGPPDYPLGTRRLFHASNTDTDQQFDVYATLEYATDHVYMWIEEGTRFNAEDVAAAAEHFEEDIYVTNRAFFGPEWSPGVDNDPHLSILHVRDLGFGTLGYFSTPDEFVAAVREDSNEMEMFYINLDLLQINSEEYHGVLAHEFQHMIHWYNDRNEDSWLNEGFADLASFLNGYDVPGHDWAFFNGPDTQLSDIDYDAPDSIASYGAAYMFTSYFLDRFGRQATQALVSHPENSFASVDAVLAELGTGLTHEELFADWVVANLLDDPSLADGQYGYEGVDLHVLHIEDDLNSSDYPLSREATVRQYGADYYRLRGEGPLLLSFTGSTQARLINTQAHSGRYLWWSNRADESDMTLTREFDLSDVDSATLEFWAWYDIEEDWDYTYVLVSVDGGETWEIVTTPSGTPTNPNGNNFGWGYTGKSGGGEEPVWIQEEVDLSPYVGQEVLIRFEQITDGAVNRPGFALDDVAIPEIGVSSDFEADGDGWEPAGFIRHVNVLPQRWLLQAVVYGPETTVQRLSLAEDQTGQWEIPLGDGADSAMFIVSALAPETTEPASYRFEVTYP
jgi:immune inhibitor A